MYAFDFDEVAVHTVAATAFELLTKRLGQGNYVTGLDEKLKKVYIKALNAPNNFFKHGEIGHKPVASIEYRPEMVEHILMLASEANIRGPKEYRLQCAYLFLIHYSFKHQNVFSKEHIDKVKQAVNELNVLGDISNKDTLKKLLNLIKNWRMPNHGEA